LTDWWFGVEWLSKEKVMIDFNYDDDYEDFDDLFDDYDDYEQDDTKEWDNYYHTIADEISED
jgi:hypothetical protein